MENNKRESPCRGFLGLMKFVGLKSLQSLGKCHLFHLVLSQLYVFLSEANPSVKEIRGNNLRCSAAFHWLKIWSSEHITLIVKISQCLAFPE